MMIPLWYGLLMGMAAAWLGFWFGRSRNWGLMELAESRQEETRPVEKNVGKASGKVEGKPQRVRRGVRYLASPTDGCVERMAQEGGIGARITTADSKLYAPSSGRVLSVAPRGNAFLILTDWGSEVEVRACNSEDDLLDRFFRPRVIRGEIIRRGKLLLEYDRERLSRECEDTAVYLCAKGEHAENLEMVEADQIKTGEALFWVK